MSTPIESLALAHTQFLQFRDTLATLTPELRLALRQLPLPIARGLLDQLSQVERQVPPLQLALDLLARAASHLPAGVHDPSTVASSG